MQNIEYKARLSDYDQSVKTALGLEGASDQGEIHPLDAVVLELRRQATVGRVGLRRHQHAGGALIEAVLREAGDYQLV